MPIHRFQGVRLQYTILSLLAWGILGLTLGARAGWTQPLSLGWTSVGIEGDLAYAPVRLDGYELFSIAAALPQPDSARSGIGALQIRRSRVENRLKSQLQVLLERAIAPNSLQVTTTMLNKQLAVKAVVDGKPSRPIVTVTSLDAEIYGLTEVELAAEFAQRIQTGLERGIAERQLEAQGAQAKQALAGGAIAVLLEAVLYVGERWLVRSRQNLQLQYLSQQHALLQQQAALSPDDPQPEAIAEQQHQLHQLKRRIEHITWRKRLLQLATVGTVLVGTAWVLQRFPQTRLLGVLLVKQPLGVLLLGLIITFTILCSRLLIDRALIRWVGTELTVSTAAQLTRRRQRAITHAKIWKDLVTALWVVVGVVLALNLITLSSGFTLSLQLGVLGVVVSLAFQSTIKDALAGTLLLARDAYTIGDVVTVQDASGVVETMGLCLTQIRNSAGQLITLRNGDITTVANASRDWARVDFTLWVDHDTDIKQALATLGEVFHELQASPDWATKHIGQPDILGVDHIDPQGILLKIRAQTAPGQQFSVTREYRLRLNQALKAKGIKPALPQRELRYRPSNRSSSNP